jgi:DNA-binding IclR family transcriptional regulator
MQRHSVRTLLDKSGSGATFPPANLHLAIRSDTRADPEAGEFRDAMARAGGLESILFASKIIEVLARHKLPMGVSALAVELGTSKARMSRFLSTMHELGWVERGESGRGYRLGWHLLRVGQAATANNPVLEHVAPMLAELRDRSGKAVVFSVPAGDNAVVVNSLRALDESGKPIYVRPGAPLYFPRSAAARVIWAFDPSRMGRIGQLRVTELLKGSPFDNLCELKRSLDLTKQNYLAATINTKGDGLGAIAAPIFDQANHLVGTLGMVVSTSLFSTPCYKRLADQVRDSARALSAKVGASVWPAAPLPVQDAD